MDIAYKYVAVNEGFIAIFENEIPDFKKGVSVGYKILDSVGYISIGETHFISTTQDILSLLEITDNIYVGVSKKEDPIVYLQGTIQISKIMIGKIIAYSEW